MRAVMLFSAVLHIAVLGLLIAYALRTWLDQRRPKEPSPSETALFAAGLGVAVLVLATVLMWMGGPFGHAFRTGLVAGVLAAASFMVALGAWPHRPAQGPMSLYSRLAALAFVGILLLTELVAFALLTSAAGGVAPYA